MFILSSFLTWNLQAKTAAQIFKGTLGLFKESVKFKDIKAANLKPVTHYKYIDLSKKKKIVYLILGDQGTGKPEQISVAKNAFNQCMKESPTSGCDFIVGMGDNIYDDGLSSSTDSKLHLKDLKQILDKFEKPYGMFGRKDFWLSVGNHDWRGNIQQAINYTKKSALWRLPNNHYKIQGLPDWLHIYALDTTRIKVLGGHNKKVKDQLYSYKNKEENEEQERRLSGILNAETALCGKKGWKMVFGHHPIFTSGSHGRHNYGSPKKTMYNFVRKKKGFVPEMRKRLVPFIHKCKIQVFMAGHEHHMEHLAGDYRLIKIKKNGKTYYKTINPNKEGISNKDIIKHYSKKHKDNFLGLEKGTFQQVLQGSSAKVREGVKFDPKTNIAGVTNYMKNKDKETYGFTIAHVTENSLTFKYYGSRKGNGDPAKLLKSIEVNLDGTTKKVSD